MSINVVIIDDESLAIQLIETHLNKFEDFKVIKTFTNPVQAIEYLQDNTRADIHVIFLDIQLPFITGLEFMNLIERKPFIVLTTAYSEYALDGFELNAFDYLVKPITFARFAKTIAKIKNSIAGNHKTEGFIYLKLYSKYIKINFAEIYYFQSHRDIIKIHLLENSSYVLSNYTLKYIESHLPEDQFTRIHKSYIVSLDKINVIKDEMVEISNQKIPIGEAYKKQFFKKIRSTLF